MHPPFETHETQSSPFSVTALDGNAAEERDLRALRDLPSQTPNLYISDNSLRSFGDTYGVRGLVNTPFFSDPSLALYVDGVPYGNAFSYSTELLDVDRIEVLRGPQGHLVGRNNSAGVIQISTRQPDDRFRAAGTLGFGTEDWQYYRVGVSGPIRSNRLHFSVAGLLSKRDGFLENTNLDTEPDSQEGMLGRVAIGWKPAENWEVLFAVTAEDFDDGTQRIAPLSGPHFKVASDFDGVTEVSANSQALRVQHVGECVTFSSVTARRDWQLDPFTLDLDLSPFAGNTARIEQRQEQWSQELRFESPDSSETWRWLAGFYFSTSEIESDSTRNFFVPVPGFFAAETTRFETDDDNYALFGQLRWRATERFEIAVGTRLDYTVKEIDRTKASTLGVIAPLDKERNYFNAAPNLTLTLELTDDVMLYGTTGIGFKPGGYSGFVDPPSSARFDTERVWANEIGVKTAWFERRLIANAAVFYYDIWDYQVERPVPGTTDLTIVNADKAQSLGAELEIAARPAEGVELSGFIGYTGIEFREYKDPVTGANLVDHRAPYTPEFNGGLAAQYTPRCGFFARAEWVVVGETYFDDLNAQRGKQSSYGIVNAKVGYERKNFALFVFGKNLEDKFYYTNKRLDLDAGVPGEPRTWGVMGTVRY